MQRERKIEKQLRAYARKRQASAGEPLKLDPVNRRLLQDEVARRAPKPGGEEASPTLWQFFGQQWAWLMGFALVIFLCATMFLPALSSAKKKAQTLGAVNNLRQLGLAAQMEADENHGKLPATLDALTNRLASDKILVDPESGQRFIYVAGGERLAGLPEDSILAYSPTDKKGRAVLFADGRVEKVTGEKFSELTNRRLPEVALAEEVERRSLAETPAASRDVSGNAGEPGYYKFGTNISPTPNKDVSGNLASARALSDQSKSEANQNGTQLNDLTSASSTTEAVAGKAPGSPPPASSGTFGTPQDTSVHFAASAPQKQALALQNGFQNTAAQAKTSSVLANFQVQQNGRAIQVVDADGSVYNGSLQPEGAVTSSGLALAFEPASAPAPPPRQAESKKTADREALPTTKNYFFRVSGVNNTLQQNVVFDGRLLANSVAVANQPPTPIGGGGGGMASSALTNQLPWSNSRIAGTAVVADTNTITVEAVPVPP